jgi:hypothetical protein
MGNLSIEFTMAFDPTPFLDPDVGLPFDLVPDAPGVVAFLNYDASAIVIYENNSMRRLVLDVYRGYEGRDALGATHIAFERCSDTAKRLADLLDEHQQIFGRAPMRITA